MFDWLISFVGGAMAEYFHRRRTPLLRIFLISLLIFTGLASVILYPYSSEASSSFNILVIVGVGVTCSVSMVVLVHIFRRQSKTVVNK